MKSFIKNKYIIILAIVILLLVVLSLGYKVYESKMTKKQIELNKSEVYLIYENFNQEQDRTNKIETLISALDKYEEYKNESKVYEEVLKEYDNKINEMRNYFITEYKTIIDENNINNISEIEDKDQINNSKNNLIDLMGKIKSEENIVLNDNITLKDYESKINNLIQSYDERLKFIEEAEKKAEEELKAMEEAKAVEEAKKLEQEQVEQEYQNLSSSNDSNSYEYSAYTPSIGSSNIESESENIGQSYEPQNSGQSNAKVDISLLEHTWNLDVDGNKIPGTDRWVDRATGDAYDENGNYIGNAYW